MSWQSLEKNVLNIAEAHWSSTAMPETVHGVKCDGVIKLKTDHWIAIEISKENTLAKLRTDLAKFASIRNANFLQNIYTQCIFISEKDVSSLKQTAQSLNIECYSVIEFYSRFIGYNEYIHERNKAGFGSVVSISGDATDSSIYTPIKYNCKNNKKTKYTTSELHEKVISGEKIILSGEFGTGKSRCVKELYNKHIASENLQPILCINLRDHWGHDSADLIIRSHLNKLGLSNYADTMVKLANSGKVVFLLDGFDEIGSQSWNGEAGRLKEIRKRSLLGVADICGRCGEAGVLITGREHYFSSDLEMMECLSLEESSEIVCCPDEFNEEQIKEYMSNNLSGSSYIPQWMPRKPLICQLIGALERENKEKLKEIFESAGGETEFFEKIFEAICVREARINKSIDSSTLRALMLELALLTREKPVEPIEISPNEINDTFYKISGRTPIDESAVMLQRLPYLGRVGGGSVSRTFIDDYAKSGLIGIALSESLIGNKQEIAKRKWFRPVGRVGLYILIDKVNFIDQYKKYARYCYSYGNYQVSADSVEAILYCDNPYTDFNGLNCVNSDFDHLYLAEREVENLHIENCFIDTIFLGGSNLKNCKIKDCIILNVEGVGSIDHLPECIDHNCISKDTKFSDVNNVGRISELGISNKHKTLIAIIQKLFFQPGRARKEEALLRGASQFWDQDAADHIIKIMKRDNIIEKHKGETGWLYVPQRKETRRMKDIVDLKNNSEDTLWTEI